ncbi:2000_t:CDS:2, partial [Racocetra persica]
RTYGKLGASIQEISKSMNSLKAINNDVEIYDTEKQDYKIIKHYECLNQYTDEEDETKTVQTYKMSSPEMVNFPQNPFGLECKEDKDRENLPNFIKERFTINSSLTDEE